jgi:hypothetical protein
LHVDSEEYARLIIVLNASSTRETTKTMVLEFKDKLRKGEEIHVPYYHPLLRLDHNQMACLGNKVNKLRSDYHAHIGSITRKKVNDARKLCGCKQLRNLVT